MSYGIGSRVNHSVYGKGKIIGYGCEKDTYRVKFDKRVDGMESKTIHKDRIRLYM